MNIGGWLAGIERQLVASVGSDAADTLMAQLEGTCLQQEARKAQFATQIYNMATEAVEREVAKYHWRKEPEMQLTKAAGMFGACVDMIQKRERCTRSRAIDMALRDPVAREAFDLSLVHARDVNDVNKIDGSSLAPQETGGTHHPPMVNQRHDGGHNPANPHPTTRNDVDEDGDSPMQKYMGRVQKLIDGGMKASKAHDTVRAAHPDLWQMTKGSPTVGDVHVDSAVNNPGKLDRSPGRSKTMLPLSHDGNSGRPAYR